MVKLGLLGRILLHLSLTFRSSFLLAPKLCKNHSPISRVTLFLFFLSQYIYIYIIVQTSQVERSKFTSALRTFQTLISVSFPSSLSLTITSLLARY